jgi:hypothetical protein
MGRGIYSLRLRKKKITRTCLCFSVIVHITKNDFCSLLMFSFPFFYLSFLFFFIEDIFLEHVVELPETWSGYEAIGCNSKNFFLECSTIHFLLS